MRHAPIDSKLFIENRERLKKLLLPKSLAIVNANDVLPTNADGSLPLHPNSDLFHLTGIEQQVALLLLDAGEVSVVGVRVLRVGAVGVGGEHIVGVADGEGLRE
ncbi:MAG: Xaa-Pro aminopeptidase, partial [Verrucomicrobiota bacterium]